MQFGGQILVRITEREVVIEVAKAQKGASCLTRLRRLAGKGRWLKDAGRQPEPKFNQSESVDVGSCSFVVQRWALLDACDFVVVGDFLCQHKETFLQGSSGCAFGTNGCRRYDEGRVREGGAPRTIPQLQLTYITLTILQDLNHSHSMSHLASRAMLLYEFDP